MMALENEGIYQEFNQRSGMNLNCERCGKAKPCACLKEEQQVQQVADKKKSDGDKSNIKSMNYSAGFTSDLDRLNNLLKVGNHSEAVRLALHTATEDNIGERIQMAKEVYAELMLKGDLENAALLKNTLQCYGVDMEAAITPHADGERPVHSGPVYAPTRHFGH